MAPERGERLDQLPIVPVEVLKRHHVHEQFDTRFRACARLLQSLWRDRQGLPPGNHQDRAGRKRRLGSLLSGAAADAGRNFMTPSIAHLVRREVAYQEAGALIEQGRLYGNLLSSMPLTFNAFAPLRFDLALATKTLRALLPQRDIAAVRHIWFEHNPGRRDPTLTGDRSAFDVAMVYDRADGKSGFVGIEVKYSEGLTEPSPTELNASYDRLAPACGLFKEPGHAALRVNPMQQLFREHLLAQAMLMRGDYAETAFMVIAPRHNTSVQQAVKLYGAFLCDPADGPVPFANVTLEALIDAIYWAGAREAAAALFDRYLDWHQVDHAVECALADRRGEWHLAPPVLAPLRLVAGGA
ncbi:hypothetical protein M9979_03015 [Sphingomonas sp. RP10(2022)]|uniref:PD-(D/E)XK nuclease-like domain-containing protein n=1 Tax=Sphingomonas liriopis TaxID=2949094 RepID=A0A9X2HUQ1_9SPHN|nr:hypothetical protein [Sphingomonas liriopis]MCP3733848.1 hypothetical protein [Sphingomonas liriopis]